LLRIRGVAHSLEAIESVAVVPRAIAVVTKRKPPAVSAGMVCDQPLVMPVNTPVAKV
jgi:hypothetical protein